jgi:hypothetical protein
MLTRGHTIIATCGVCAAIVFGSASNSLGSTLAGRPPVVVPGAHWQPGPALTKERIAALAEIQRAATEAGLHPGVFGPREAANVSPGITRPVTHGDGLDWGDAGIAAGGAFALTLIACGGVLTARRGRRDRIQVPVLTDRKAPSGAQVQGVRSPDQIPLP